MQTKAKSNSVITHAVAGDVITFTVRDAGEVRLDVSAVSEANRQRAMFHGFIQRISDAAAISRNPETGQPATPQEKLAAMQGLVEHYASGAGEWSRRSAGGIAPEGGLLFRALAKLYPEKSPETIREFLAKRSKSEKAALLVTPDVARVADELRAEGARGVDAGELLKGLTGG